jgi:hypothetical protein
MKKYAVKMEFTDFPPRDPKVVHVPRITVKRTVVKAKHFVDALRAGENEAYAAALPSNRLTSLEVSEIAK